MIDKDIDKIAYHTGLKRNEFVLKKINPKTNNIVSIMRTNEDGCVFFNDANGRCKIYSFRPTDCRLFPLDIEINNGDYYWTLFKHKVCNLDDVYFRLLNEYKIEALENFKDHLFDYATYPVPGMEIVGYKTLNKIYP